MPFQHLPTQPGKHLLEGQKCSLGWVADWFLSPWQEADIAVAPLTVTSAREEVVSFTTPFLQTGIGILLRKDTASQDMSFFHFLSPFSKETWTALLFAYLLTCFCLFLVARYKCLCFTDCVRVSGFLTYEGIRKSQGTFCSEEPSVQV